MFSSIMVAVDPDERASWSKAIPAALALARCFGARLTFVTVVPDRRAAIETQWSKIGYRALTERAHARLVILASENCAELPFETQVGGGSICGGVLALADKVHADLIVLASRRSAVRDWLIATNVSRIVRNARCSVLVVREPDPSGRRRRG